MSCTKEVSDACGGAADRQQLLEASVLDDVAKWKAHLYYHKSQESRNSEKSLMREIKPRRTRVPHGKLSLVLECITSSHITYLYGSYFSVYHMVVSLP